MVENGVCWQKLSDDELSRLMHWAVSEGAKLASRPRLVRLFGILAADLRFELWMRAQSGKKERLNAETQGASVCMPRSARAH